MAGGFRASASHRQKEAERPEGIGGLRPPDLMSAPAYEGVAGEGKGGELSFAATRPLCESGRQ